MKANLGTIDRIARVLLGVAAAALYFTGMISGVVAIVIGAVAAVLVLTSVVGTCPIYLGLGLSTRKSES